MFRWGSRPWDCRTGFDMSVDFCVWVLETDGLQVSPFSRHRDGDGALRERGLTADAWREWTANVVAASAELTKRTQDPAADKARAYRELAPPAVWNGQPPVGEHLAALWEHYGPLLNARKDAEPVLMIPILQSDAMRRLWDDLAPYRKSLDALNVLFVGYPGPMDYLVPPRSVLMGIDGWRPNGAALGERILSAAMRLAGTVSQPS